MTRMSPDEIVRRVALLNGLTVKRLLGRERHESVAKARRQAARLLRRCGMSLPEIGRVLRRDHATILYMLRRGEPRRIVGAMAQRVAA